METTTAWVLYKKEIIVGLVEETFTFPAIEADEVLIEPLFGSWEGNMGHAVKYDPIDVCVERGEEKVVIGNSGVVRVLKTGKDVNNFKEGDICMLLGSGILDKYGYPLRIVAFDMIGSIGLLAKRGKVPQHTLLKVPENTQYSLQQWAAFPVRFITGWANWKMAYGAYRLQAPVELNEKPFIFAWGGGVSFAQALLARYYGFDVAMVASKPERLDLLRSFGIIPIDRRNYPALDFDEATFYQFRKDIKELSSNKEISIIFDHLGGENFKTTLRLLGREGVIASEGWKAGMQLFYSRANACINRQFLIHTHGANFAESIEATDFAVNNNWHVPPNSDYYSWDAIPQLASDFENQKIISYFPLYQVNPF